MNQLMSLKKTENSDQLLIIEDLDVLFDIQLNKGIIKNLYRKLMV